MERDGLVQRKADPNDRRSSIVSLTSAAEKKVRALEAAIAKINDRALAGLSVSEKASFLAALAKVINVLQAGEDQSRARRAPRK